ncbi:UNVERIFIED_CONTAM: hypothetical protein OHV15_06390 [Microbacterium sp. SLM126]
MNSFFFAYSSANPVRAETMRNAANQLSGSGVAATTWEDLNIEGNRLVSTICSAIQKVEDVIAEVSDLNSNVLFEAGYALALGKRVWLAVDDTDAEAMRNWRELGILATVGRLDYQGNSHSVTAKLIGAQDVESTLIESLLVNGKPREADAVFAPSTPFKFEATSSLEKHLDRQGHIKILGAADDLGLAPLDFYVKEIYRSSAALFHLMARRRIKSAEHNARVSFLAGIAHGFELPVLLVAEKDGTVPLDYRDLTFEYTGSAQLITRVDRWLHELPKAPGSNRRLGRLALDIELPIRSFGEYVAEYEKTELSNYFISTSEFESVLAGRTKVFVGRKGTGKTATMTQTAEELRRDRRVLVVPVKPSAYELSGLADVIRTLSTHGTSDYLVISLWTYLLYTEIALRMVAYSRERVGQVGASSELGQLEAEIAELGLDPSEDMATRLEHALTDLTREAKRHGEGVSEFVSRQLRLHRLNKLKTALMATLRDFDRVAVLIDNLDKAWERGADFGTLSKFILGLLVAIGQLEKDFARPAHGTAPVAVAVSMTVFLRSDIYDSLKRFAREPDKIGVATVHWNDEELLARVLEERYAANKDGRRNAKVFDMWSEIFDSEVRGLRTRDYLMWKVLPRPRDLIYLANEALTTAINRKHQTITASDILFAEEQYSRFAVEALLVESEAEEFDLDAALFEFAGMNATFDEADLRALLADVPFGEEVMQWLIQSSILGIETRPGKFLHVEGRTDAERQLRVARRIASAASRPVRYRVHPAVRNYLLIQDDDLHDDSVVDATLSDEG